MRNFLSFVVRLLFIVLLMILLNSLENQEIITNHMAAAILIGVVVAMLFIPTGRTNKLK